MKSLGSWFGQAIDIHVHTLDALDAPSPLVLNDTARLARHFGIGRLVYVGNLPGLNDRDPGPERVRQVNDYTLQAVTRRPDAFLGFCYLNPTNPVSFTEGEIARCVVNGGMRGIKLHVAVKAVDSRLDPIAARAGELGIPILYHGWYKMTRYSYNESTPAEIADLARRFPRTTIIWAHLGGGRERGVLDVVDVPNLLVDTSGSQPEAGLVEYAVRQLGAERVVFGSDVIYGVTAGGRDFGTQMGRVLGARVSEAERDLILHGNAARILGLSGGIS